MTQIIGIRAGFLRQTWKGRSATGVRYRLIVRAFVINLRRSVERRRHMEMQVAGLDHEFVEAVDGRELDLSDPVYRRGMWPGEAGAGESHLKVYRRVLEDGLSHALVLEDDVILPSDLNLLLDGLIRISGREAALLYYRTNPHFNSCPLVADGAVSLPGDRRLLRPQDVRPLADAGAYVITGEACRTMLDLRLPVRYGADWWGMFVREGGLERVRCVAPRPIDLKVDFPTTLGFTGRLSRLVPVRARTLRRRRQIRRTSRFPIVPGEAPNDPASAAH